MLDTTTKNLWQEIEGAEKFRDQHLSRMSEMIQKYAGQGYRSDWNGDWAENHLYEFIRLTTGRIIYDNPRVRVKTRRPGSQRAVAEAIGHGLNRWVEDVDLRRILKKIYADMCFAYGVALTVVEPQPHLDPREPSIAQWPMMHRLDCERFFLDPLCTSVRQARYMGHKWIIDKQTLLEMALKNKQGGWDYRAIDSLTTGTGIEGDKTRKDRKLSLDRNEVVCYDVWVPEVHTEDPDDGFHGTIYTLAMGQGGDKKPDGSPNGPTEIRKPRGFYGPRWGPYTMFGVYPVPGDPYPLSPFSAMYQQMSDLNDSVQAAQKSIREYKRLLFVSDKHPNLPKIIANTPDGFVIPVKGMDGDNDVIQREVGGLNEQHLAQIQMLLQRMDRNTGISETQRGNLPEKSTATAIAVADSAGDISLGFIKQEFSDSTVQVLKTAGWYMYHDDRIEMPLGEEAAEVLGMSEPWLVGGSYADDSGARFDDLELKLEPYSMERTNEALLRAQHQDLANFVLQSAQVMQATPQIRWADLYSKTGEAVNQPAFGEIIDSAVLAQIQGLEVDRQKAEIDAELAKQVPDPGSVGGSSVNTSPSGNEGTGLPGNRMGGALGGLRQVQGVA